jgi:hypothetical protein
MAQRDSGFERQDHELYETPGWVTRVLMDQVRLPPRIWEPACGHCLMVDELRKGYGVFAGDVINHGHLLQDAVEDFLAIPAGERREFGAVVTNPPYGRGGALARQFIEHALATMRPVNGIVAMLLPIDFDSAKGRRHLFAECPAFAQKIVLQTRIRWFAGSTGSPSANHAWFVWDWYHGGLPTLTYGVKP